MVKTINANSVYDRPIRIGYEGENIVTAITFNLAMWIDEFGTGAAVLLVQRNGDSNAYPVPLTIENGSATWEITSTDCAKTGRGAIQIAYTAGEQVKKSPIFTIVCAASIEGSDTPPDPYESWLADLTELTATTETNAQRAEDAAERAEEAAEGGGGGEGGADGFSPIATDIVSKGVINNAFNVNALIVRPSDVTDISALVSLLNPRTWFVWLNGTEVEFARLGVSLNSSNNAVTMYLRGRTSIASGIMGVDTAWTITADDTDAYKTKVDTLWTDYQSAITALG